MWSRFEKLTWHIQLHFVHFVMTAQAPSLRNGQSGVMEMWADYGMEGNRLRVQAELVIYSLVLGWLPLQWRPRRLVLAFALPLAIVILATCAYNRLTIGAFTITPFGAVHLLGAVTTYVEEAPSACGRPRGGAGDSRQHGKPSAMVPTLSIL